MHSVEGCAYQMRYLWTHPDSARQLGLERTRACEGELQVLEKPAVKPNS
jgi:hypothetical protein